MMALCLTVFLASLVGSLHCAGMCGAFVAFAIGIGDPSVKTSRTVLLSAYQAGRLMTYMFLGAVAGIVGSALDMSGRWVGVQRSAAVAAGALMVGFGLLTLLRLFGARIASLAVPRGLIALTAAGHAQAMRFSPLVRALVTGFLTTLLPCGWLYAFVITSAGTGHATHGALLMATFWLGTLPVMSLVGIGIRRLAAPLAAKLPAVSATAVVIVGLYTIMGRAQVVLPTATHTAASLVDQVQRIDQAKLPCCTMKEAP